MSLTLFAAPLLEPLTLDAAKAHLRIDINDEDAEVLTLITVARMRCEGATRRTLITQTWDFFLDQWPTCDAFSLPKAPLQQVSFVKYVDLAGVTQTWDPANYLVDAPVGDRCARGRLSLGWVKVWPVVRPTMNAIQIRMVTGYGDSDEDVPAILRQAMLLDIGTLYEVRQSILTDKNAAAIDVGSTTKDIYKAFRSL